MQKYKSYPKHHLMRKNRLIKLQETQGKCEICKTNKAYMIHHKDFSMDNHSLDNLIVVCCRCHRIIHANRNPSISKYKRIYGMTLLEIAKQIQCSSATVVELHRKKLLHKILENKTTYKRTSKFIRLYNMNLVEIALKLKCSFHTVIKLHIENKLQQILNENRRWHTSKYIRLYGINIIEIGHILRKSISTISHLQQNNQLSELLTQKVG